MVNGVVERAYNKVVTSLMVIVKCYLIGGTEVNLEKYHSILQVFMKIFDLCVSSLQVSSVISAPNC
jgi:hypothetical protein